MKNIENDACFYWDFQFLYLFLQFFPSVSKENENNFIIFLLDFQKRQEKRWKSEKRFKFELI